MDDLEAKEVADFDEEISRLLGPGGVVNRPAPAAAGRTSTSTTSATSAAARMLDQALEGKATISPRAAAAAERALADDELELDALVRRQEAAKLALPFDPTRLFQPEAYRETAAAFISEYMQGRAMSSDPKVRQVAHFEGQLSPQAFNEMMARPIDPQDIAFMKQTGYRILEFGKQTFEDVLRALQVYRVHHGHINVPQDYAITEKIVHAMRRHSTTSSSSDSRIGYDNDRESDSEEEEEEEADDSVSMQTIGARAAKPLRTKAPSPPSPPPPPPAAATTMPIYDDSLVGLLLGEAVASLRNGDIDGLEDPARRRALDALGFDWGDLSTYQRYRFMPLLLGLRIYKHLFGFPMPQSDFVVPDAPQWPYWMTGMPLGEWASVVRIQQQMVAVHYPERMDMLNALEFLWWIPPGEGVPAKYYEPVQ